MFICVYGKAVGVEPLATVSGAAPLACPYTHLNNALKMYARRELEGARPACAEPACGGGLQWRS